MSSRRWSEADIRNAGCRLRQYAVWRTSGADDIGSSNMTDRKQYLDGLRGIAAAFVVLEHMSALFPFGFWGLGKGTAGDVATGIADFTFRAGTFSVHVFF